MLRIIIDCKFCSICYCNLRIKFNKYIVLEDFHYLKTDVQRDFAIELKAFHESSDLCFVIVGVWLDENKLIIYNGDLTGRVVSINADEWTSEDMKKVVKEGERLLNIHFDEEFVDSLIAESFENIYLVQEVCHRICEENNILETQEILKDIGYCANVRSLIQEIVKEQSGRYNSFITNYAHGFQETNLEMHKWLLYPILKATIDDLSKGLTYRTIKTILQTVHPRGRELNPGNLTQALQSVVSLQLKKSIQPIIIDYDESNLTLHIVDKGFIIWLSVKMREDILALAELPCQ